MPAGGDAPVDHLHFFVDPKNTQIEIHEKHMDTAGDHTIGLFDKDNSLIRVNCLLEH
jgi:hypothetical protein